MLRKILTISLFAICGFVGAQASEEVTIPVEREDSRDLTPGLLVCNSKEKDCVKSHLVIQDEENDENQKETKKILACKDCQ